MTNNMLDQSQSGVRQSAGDQHPWHRNLRSHDGVSISKSRMVVGSCCVSPLSIIMARPRRTTRSLWRLRSNNTTQSCTRAATNRCAGGRNSARGLSPMDHHRPEDHPQIAARIDHPLCLPLLIVRPAGFIFKESDTVVCVIFVPNNALVFFTASH